MATRIIKILILSSFCFIPFLLEAQTTGVAINTTGAAPHGSAILDVSATDKGMLVPRVALTGRTDVTSVPSAATGLLIYNTATAGTAPNNVTPGFYFWDGSAWTRLVNDNGNITADNGLTKTGNNIRLGGTLLEETQIAQAGYNFLFTGTGSVGIGVSTPSHKLHVAGGTRTEDGFLANDGTATLPSYRFTADTDNGMFRPAANHIGFSMNGVEKIRFHGNATDALVGINNTSPTAPIDLIRTTDNSMLVGTNYGNPPNYDFRRAQGTVSAPTLIGNSGVLARLRAFGYDGSTFVSAAQIAFEVDAASGAGDMPGRIVFSTTPDGSTTLTERMRITSAGVVGIGTSSPSASLRLDVQNGTIGNTHFGINAGLNLWRANGTQASPADVTTDNTIVANINMGYRIGGTIGNYARIRSSTEGTPSSTSDAPANLTFWTTADGSGTITERMRISANGNVGLNTTTPDDLLDVENGNFRMTGNNNKFVFNNKEVNNGWTLIYRDDFESGTAEGWALYQGVNSSATRSITVANPGFVGLSRFLTNHSSHCTGCTNADVFKKEFDMSGISWTEAEIRFQYHFIDSWDGRERAWAGVSNSITGNPTILWVEDHDADDDLNGRASYTWFGSTSWGEFSKNAVMTVRNNAGGNIFLYFGNTCNDVVGDESMGIDNIEIWVR